MSNQSKAYLYALLAILLWSSVATAFKITLKYISPIELLFYSSLFSLISPTNILFSNFNEKKKV